MDKGWLELESDPGLFTLLLEDFGVKGVQVEEIYDLQKPIEGTVYGFIFLFKWIEERRSRRKIIQEELSFVVDEEIVNGMYFAQQVIPNSCATHALLSVLLNQTKVDLGETLTKLKLFTQGMNPEDKGFAIGNMPDLARAHNSHARPEAPRRKEKQQGISSVRTMEAFHFVSYVPINGRLFELDGLKPCPIDHGPWGESEEWTEKFRRVIKERLGMATSGGEPYHDIRFNLMAVVPDREQLYETKLKTLKTNRQIVLEALQQMVKVTNPELSPDSTKAGLRGKAEPILTRSVAAAAREALANHQAEKAAEKRQSKRNGGDDEEDAEVTEMDADGSPASIPAVLDCHSYAKSPIMEVKDEDEQAMDTTEMLDTEQVTLNTANGEKMSISELSNHNLTPVKENSVKIHVSVSDDQEGAVAMPTTVATTDVTKPLSIQTRFSVPISPGPGSESTDTASEVGSLIHSPASSNHTSANSSPNTSFAQKLANRSANMEVTPEKVAIDKEALLKVKADLEGADSVAVEKPEIDKTTVNEVATDGKILNEKLSPRSAKSKFTSAHGFTPKDLLALLKTVENEIKGTELNLHDEKEKKKKFKIDDCRRTHNYDQFVFTFLSMLAEQGHLAGLVEQALNNKRRPGVSLSSLHKIHTPSTKRKSRPKKKR